MENISNAIVNVLYIYQYRHLIFIIKKVIQLFNKWNVIYILVAFYRMVLYFSTGVLNGADL